MENSIDQLLVKKPQPVSVQGILVAACLNCCKANHCKDKYLQDARTDTSLPRGEQNGTSWT